MKSSRTRGANGSHSRGAQHHWLFELNWKCPLSLLIRIPSVLTMIRVEARLQQDRTSETMTSQSRHLLIRGLPLMPTRQCSFEWFSQWPVRPAERRRE